MLSDIVIYCKSVHFDGFEHAKDKQGFYEMSSFKEGKAFNLAESSGKPTSNLKWDLYFKDEFKSRILKLKSVTLTNKKYVEFFQLILADKK